MKGKRFLAVTLAALMTASSASFSAFAEDESATAAQAQNVEGYSVNSNAVEINGTDYSTLEEAMNSLSSMSGDIVIKLTGTVSYEFNAREDFTKSYTGGTITFEGTEENRATVLDLCGKDSDATPIKSEKKLIFKNLTINKTNNNEENGSTWNRHAINFQNVVEFDEVTVNTAVSAGPGSSFKNVDFNETGEYYCLWIIANSEAETVVDSCNFIATNAGRGIKVGDQYTYDKDTQIDNSKKVSLTVKNSAFNTAKKAAVLVSNVKGADITAYGNDISNVSEDNANFVWIDEGKNDQQVPYSKSINEITVKDENGAIIANSIKIENGEQIADYKAMYGWYDADATEYTLNNVNEYIGFVNIINGKATGIDQSYFQGKTVKLASDLDFQDVDFLKADASGNVVSDLCAAEFCGTFDGDGHTMKNIKYNVETNSSNWGIGIFRSAAGATFKNVTVDGITVKSNATISFGGLVVSAYKNSKDTGCTFENCNIKNIDADIDNANGFNGQIGGLAGYIKDNSVVKNCSVENFDFNAKNGVVYAGGLCGYFFISNAEHQSGEVTDCTVKNFKLSATKAGGRYSGAGGNFGGIGGLLGYGHSGNDSYLLPITNCNVTELDINIGKGFNEAYLGGFIGMSRRRYAAKNCSVSGKITAGIAENYDHFYVGGFVGGAPGATPTGWSFPAFSYDNCTADVNITVTGKTVAGGFAGIAGASWTQQNFGDGVNVEFKDCTAKGTVVAEGIAGGFAGIADRGVYTNCIASETTVTGATVGGFIGSVEIIAEKGTGYKVTLSDCSGSNGVKFFGQTSDKVEIDAQSGGVATINNKIYYDFADAIANANDGDTVKLIADASGDGIVFPQGKFETGLTVDLNGKTYTISGRAVGSSEDSRTNGFQLLKNNNITFKNGKITSTEDAQCHNKSRGDHKKLSILIQNYSNLTLEGVELDGANLLTDGYEPYALSNNNGTVKINKSTITAQKGYAFDVCNSASYEGVNVTVEDSIINGYVQIDRNTASSTRAFLHSGNETYSENGDYVQVGDKFIKAEKRSIEISANKAEVEMDEIFTVTVTLKGKDMANVRYDLMYDTSKFKYVSGAENAIEHKNGVIKVMEVKTGENDVFENGVTWTYTFKALGQAEEVTGYFGISNTEAYTWEESHSKAEPITSNNEKVGVKIKLAEYKKTLKLDGETTEKTSETVAYTKGGHTFVVITEPLADVSYKVNDGKADKSVKIDENGVFVTKTGEYVIEYTITPANGYALYTGEFTLVVGAPDFVVEVNLTRVDGADYVKGKKLVLVYTDEDGAVFSYGGNLMIEVTNQSPKYEYAGDQTTQKVFNHVYAFVTDAIEGEGGATVTVDDYKKNISCIMLSEEDMKKDEYKALTYAMDINCDTKLNAKDITEIYGIYNVRTGWFGGSVEEQKHLLRADTNGNKWVEGRDTAAVVNAVKEEILKK